jgi:hypothetical protein
VGQVVEQLASKGEALMSNKNFKKTIEVLSSVL